MFHMETIIPNEQTNFINNSRFSEAVRSYRASRGLSLRKAEEVLNEGLPETVHVSYGTIKNWEEGKYISPHPRIFFALKESAPPGSPEAALAHNALVALGYLQGEPLPYAPPVVEPAPADEFPAGVS